MGPRCAVSRLHGVSAIAVTIGCLMTPACTVSLQEADFQEVQTTQIDDGNRPADPNSPADPNRPATANGPADPNSSADPNNPADPNSGKNTSAFESIAAQATRLGRMTLLPDNPGGTVRMTWSGAALGVRFIGSQLSARMQDSGGPRYADTGGQHNVYEVVVDGGAPGATLTMSDQAQTYMLAQGLPAVEHVLWLRRRSESVAAGQTDIWGLELGEGGRFLTPPPRRSRRIEVLGASTSSGWGVEGTDPCDGTSANENPFRAFPFLAAEALGAELSPLSTTGVSVAFPFDGARPTVVQLFGRLDPLLATPLWDFSSAPVDAVVMDVGGNDLTALRTDSFGPTLMDAKNKMIAALVGLVAAQRRAYSNPRIYLFIHALHNTQRRATLEDLFQGVITQTQAAGVTPVAIIKMDYYGGNEHGCQFHPSVSLHRSMGEQLAARLRTDLGW